MSDVETDIQGEIQEYYERQQEEMGKQSIFGFNEGEVARVTGGLETTCSKQLRTQLRNAVCTLTK